MSHELPKSTTEKPCATATFLQFLLHRLGSVHHGQVADAGSVVLVASFFYDMNH